jgi:hypothetical protein
VNSDSQNHRFKIQNWTIIYHGTEHFVSHHFSSFETTHYAFSSSTFALHQRLTFSQGDVQNLRPYTSTPQRFWIYLHELQHENFSPVVELKYLNICVLRFISGKVCQQLPVTTKRCNCFRGDKSWENDGLLLGSLSQHEDIMLATCGSTSLGMSSRLFWNPTAPTTCIGFNPLHGTRMVASSHRITPKL